MGAAGYDQLGSRMKRTKSFRGVLHQSYTAGIIMNTASTFMSLLLAMSSGILEYSLLSEREILSS